MEVTSTPDMISVITDINQRDRHLEEVDLKEVDDAMDELEERNKTENNNMNTELTNCADPTTTSGPDKMSKNTAMRDLTADKVLLELRWEGENNVQVRKALEDFTESGEAENEVKEEMFEWFKANSDRELVDEAMTEVDNWEARLKKLGLLEESVYKCILTGFVSLLSEIVKRWHEDGDHDHEVLAGEVFEDDDSEAESWTNDEWQNLDSPGLGDGDKYPDMMGNAATETEASDRQEKS